MLNTYPSHEKETSFPYQDQHLLTKLKDSLGGIAQRIRYYQRFISALDQPSEAQHLDLALLLEVNETMVQFKNTLLLNTRQLRHEFPELGSVALATHGDPLVLIPKQDSQRENTQTDIYQVLDEILTTFGKMNECAQQYEALLVQAGLLGLDVTGSILHESELHDIQHQLYEYQNTFNAGVFELGMSFHAIKAQIDEQVKSDLVRLGIY